jgi:tRNA-2-methylthio-N6-dimethylallyladenosine synthase
VDLVFGTHAVARLPENLNRVRGRRRRVVDVGLAPFIEETDDGEPMAAEEGGVSRFVTVMHGCDNFCTYCVVPYVRGRESSREPGRILSEIQCLVDAGVREVTLLGQNVNSYGTKEGWCSFAALLAAVEEVKGLERVRFTTSHPRDLSGELIDAFGRLRKLCAHIHLPVQSGSDAVLRRMNRGYDRQFYEDRIRRLRAVRPDMAVTTDFIVGFPGETGADFEDTLELMRAVRFDGAFAFAYSDRPQAPARRFSNKVGEDEKSRRLQRLLALQEAHTLESHRALVDHLQPVLIEEAGLHRVDAAETIRWSGRTPGNKIVHGVETSCPLESSMLRPGRTVVVRIEKAFAHSLRGSAQSEGKGECHAA